MNGRFITALSVETDPAGKYARALIWEFLIVEDRDLVQDPISGSLVEIFEFTNLELLCKYFSYPQHNITHVKGANKFLYELPDGIKFKKIVTAAINAWEEEYTKLKSLKSIDTLSVRQREYYKINGPEYDTPSAENKIRKALFKSGLSLAEVDEVINQFLDAWGVK